MKDAGTPTRRRRLAPILFSVLAILALVLIASAVGVGAGGLPWTEPDDEAAAGYPQRIERPYVVRDLPGQPGPLAALIESDGGWKAISPRGRIWNLADADEDFEVQPALSSDGRILAYLRKSDDGFGEYVVRDLGTGVLTVIPGVSSAASESDATFYIAMQRPSFLSPDGKQVLVQGGRTEGRNADGLVLSEATGVREIFINGPVLPAGWLPDGRIAWLTMPDGLDASTRSPELIATTDTGKEIGRMQLELSRPILLDHWSPSLSPDGDLLILTSYPPGVGSSLVSVSMSSGQEVARLSLPDEWVSSCQPAFRDDQVLVPTYSGEEATDANGVVLVDPDNDPVVLADPRIRGGCSVWAAQAIAGDEQRGLSGRVFGTNESWWMWRWRELSAALLLVIAGLGLWGARPNAG